MTATTCLWMATVALPVQIGATADSGGRINQHSELELDCGPSSAAVVAAFLAMEVSDEQLASLSQDGVGASLTTLSQFFATRGLVARPELLTTSDLLELVSPAILYVSSTPDGSQGGHFVVCLGATASGRFLIVDATKPLAAQHPWSVADLSASWDGSALPVRRATATDMFLTAGRVGLVFAGTFLLVSGVARRRRAGVTVTHG